MLLKRRKSTRRCSLKRDVRRERITWTVWASKQRRYWKRKIGRERNERKSSKDWREKTNYRVLQESSCCGGSPNKSHKSFAVRPREGTGEGWWWAEKQDHVWSWMMLVADASDIVYGAKLACFVELKMIFMKTNLAPHEKICLSCGAKLFHMKKSNY